MTRSKLIVRGLFVIVLLAGLAAGILAPMFAPVQAAPQKLPVTHIVISEFRTSGPSGGNDEFIEFFNPTMSSVSMGGWIVKRSNSSGSTNLTYTFPANSTSTLAPGQHYLIANTSVNGYSGSVTPDGTYSTGISDNGGIALFDTTNTIVD